MKKILLLLLSASLLVITSCFWEEESDSSYYKVSFRADSVQKTFKSLDGVGFNYDDYYDSWGALWNESEPESPSLYIKISEPVNSGSAYNQSSGLTVYYDADGNDTLYSNDSSLPFSLTITEWGGLGGMARGTFAGTLEQWDGSTVIISDGIFEASIDEY